MWLNTKPPTLKRSIGLWSAVAINVGAIIGGGIFVVTGIAAGYAGSAMIISMIFAGAIAFLTATSLAKLTAWQPVEGGSYEYGRQLISPFAGFLSGWMWLVANTFTGAAVSLGFAAYLASAVPGIPTNIVAAVMCLVFTGLNLVGAKQSASVNNIFVAIKLAILAFFIIFGAFSADLANFTAIHSSFKRRPVRHFLHLLRLRRIRKSLSHSRGNQRRQTQRAPSDDAFTWDFNAGLRTGWVGCGWAFRCTRACGFFVALELRHYGDRQPISGAAGRSRRLSSHRKRALDSNFGGFPHGLLYGETKRLALLPCDAA